MKNAQRSAPAEWSTSDAHQDDSPPSSFLGTENPRPLRVIVALMRAPCTRTEIDTAAGGCNVPEVIAQLRRRGLTIICEQIQKVARDGVPVWPGLYRLTGEDLQQLRAWLADRADEQSDEGR